MQKEPVQDDLGVISIYAICSKCVCMCVCCVFLLSVVILRRRKGRVNHVMMSAWHVMEVGRSVWHVERVSSWRTASADTTALSKATLLRTVLADAVLLTVKSARITTHVPVSEQTWVIQLQHKIHWWVYYFSTTALVKEVKYIRQSISEFLAVLSVSI